MAKRGQTEALDGRPQSTLRLVKCSSTNISASPIVAVAMLMTRTSSGKRAITGISVSLPNVAFVLPRSMLSGDDGLVTYFFSFSVVVFSSPFLDDDDDDDPECLMIARRYAFCIEPPLISICRER